MTALREELRLITMCDERFVPQMLVLLRSLQEGAGGPVPVRVLALDSFSSRVLGGLREPSVEVLELRELEEADPELAARREGRTWTEYCWTVTPAFCAHELERAPAGAVVAWLDADVAFLRDPAEILACIGDASTLLVPHRYYRLYPSSAPVWLLTECWGTFNGGTIAFRHDADGLAAVHEWRTMTLDWCYDRVEAGRFGNQRHLTDFPRRFAGVRVMDVPGGVLGPWNAGQFALARDAAAGILADGRPVLSYHYQSLRLRRTAWWFRLMPRASSQMPLPPPARGLVARTTPWYRIGRSERALFWRPYLSSLAAEVARLDAAEGIVADFEPLGLGDAVGDLRHRLRLTGDRVRHRVSLVLGRLPRSEPETRPSDPRSESAGL